MDFQVCLRCPLRVSAEQDEFVVCPSLSGGYVGYWHSSSYLGRQCCDIFLLFDGKRIDKLLARDSVGGNPIRFHRSFSSVVLRKLFSYIEPVCECPYSFEHTFYSGTDNKLP